MQARRKATSREAQPSEAEQPSRNEREGTGRPLASRRNLGRDEARRELLDEQSPELLHELHLLTPEGKLNADARRKLKQVNHLYQLLLPALEDVAARHPELTVVDVGAGKAYLGFILYQLFLRHRPGARIVSIESRAELVDRGREIAGKLGFERMELVASRIERAALPERVHLLTALHACDTASDDALVAGVRAGADHIALIPCCQAEVAELLKAVRGELWRHGIHRREFGSHLTNVIRCLLLEAFGYQVTVTELVGWEHSLKNELILARKIQRENPAARARLDRLLAEYPIRPSAVRQLCSG